MKSSLFWMGGKGDPVSWKEFLNFGCSSSWQSIHPYSPCTGKGQEAGLHCRLVPVSDTQQNKVVPNKILQNNLILFRRTETKTFLSPLRNEQNLWEKNTDALISGDCHWALRVLRAGGVKSIISITRTLKYQECCNDIASVNLPYPHWIFLCERDFFWVWFFYSIKLDSNPRNEKRFLLLFVVGVFWQGKEG